MAETLSVGPADAGSRLDLFLKSHPAAGSRKAAKRLLDQGRVRVNGRKTIIASWELKKGDEVWVASDERPPLDASRYFLKVIHEDDDLIVVEKDAGIPSETTAQTLKPSLVQIINAYLEQQAPPGTKPYLGLIHRLDTDTSGLMVYTKKKAANKISLQFKDHSIIRRYHAVVLGQVEQEHGHIKVPLAKVGQGGGRKVQVAPRGQGLTAETQYRILERYQEASLIEVMPTTGRTHQLRVHLAHIGHPIVGDKLYGVKGGPRFKRQALHAAVLGFKHPITKKKLKFENELPKDMRRLVDTLRVKV